MEIEQRTSMERHLMARDREGQLYLEARRQQALDLLDNRTSFLSTITPPSSSPSSAASSLFHEPPPTTTASVEESAPAGPNPAVVPAPATLAPVSLKKKRQQTAGRGRAERIEAPSPMIPISPSSLEYQLTANLLKTLDNHPRHQSRSRSRPRHRTRGTASKTALPEDGHSRGRISLPTPVAPITVAELTPTSLRGSIPSSPVSTQTPSWSQSSASDTPKESLPQLVSVPLPPIPPSPPLPPLPPKSPRSLIAHYFPGSLPPPPSRKGNPLGQNEALVAPVPFKTPTFGPAFTLSTENAPPMPSPSTSFPSIPSTNISRSAYLDLLDHRDCSTRPSPSTSALGFSVSRSTPAPPQPPVDLDSTQHYRRPIVNSHYTVNVADDNCALEPASVLLFAPVRPRSPHSSPSASPVPPSPAMPIYPKGLLASMGPLADPLVGHGRPHKAVPYVSDLFSKESTSLPSSANTSHDLEMILGGIHHDSIDPWSFHPWDNKPLPPIRREKGSRYWVFRDQDGLVPGPLLFVLGHFCPLFWFIGAVCPLQNPSEIAPAGSLGPTDPLAKAQPTWMRLEAERAFKWFRTPGATDATLPVSSGAVKDDGLESAEPTHGPWSAKDESSLFELRMARDRKVLRYELELRWKRINLAWSVGSFVIAVAVAAVVICIV